MRFFRFLAVSCLASLIGCQVTPTRYCDKYLPETAAAKLECGNPGMLGEMLEPVSGLFEGRDQADRILILQVDDRREEGAAGWLTPGRRMVTLQGQLGTSRAILAGVARVQMDLEAGHTYRVSAALHDKSRPFLFVVTDMEDGRVVTTSEPTLEGMQVPWRVFEGEWELSNFITENGVDSVELKPRSPGSYPAGTVLIISARSPWNDGVGAAAPDSPEDVRKSFERNGFEGEMEASGNGPLYRMHRPHIAAHWEDDGQRVPEQTAQWSVCLRAPIRGSLPGQ
ncbi:MAG: hypothetical protein R3E96_10100 [Planctomycetota bacterium]